MIIIGYQGIGKSTLCKNYGKCIDLESGNFFVDNNRPDDWYKYYCKMAISLSRDNKIVFTSSHKVVRDYLALINTTEKIYIICPSLKLKNEWLAKLKSRYERTLLDKDNKAYLNALSSYDENISDLINSKDFPCIQIEDIDYLLINYIPADE